MRTKIQNSIDLQAEILRLRNERFNIENDLQIETNKLTANLLIPIKLLSKLKAWFVPYDNDDTKISSDKDSRDWVTSAFRIGLPVLLNKFIFPRSGFLLKYAVAFLSQNAAKSLNKNAVTEMIENLSDWVKSKKRIKRREPRMVDYGIPPHSETF